MDDRRDVPAAEGTRGIATVTVLLLVMVNAVSDAAIPQWFPECLSTRELIVAAQHTHTQTHTCHVRLLQCSVNLCTILVVCLKTLIIFASYVSAWTILVVASHGFLPDSAGHAFRARGRGLRVLHGFSLLPWS